MQFFNKARLNNSEEDIIKNIYDERSKVDIYFKSSSKKVKEGVKARYIKEKKKALEYLKKEME